MGMRYNRHNASLINVLLADESHEKLTIEREQRQGNMALS